MANSNSEIDLETRIGATEYYEDCLNGRILVKKVLFMLFSVIFSTVET